MTITALVLWLHSGLGKFRLQLDNGQHCCELWEQFFSKKRRKRKRRHVSLSVVEANRDRFLLYFISYYILGHLRKRKAYQLSSDTAVHCNEFSSSFIIITERITINQNIYISFLVSSITAFSSWAANTIHSDTRIRSTQLIQSQFDSSQYSFNGLYTRLSHTHLYRFSNCHCHLSRRHNNAHVCVRIIRSRRSLCINTCDEIYTASKGCLNCFCLSFAETDSGVYLFLPVLATE